MAAKNVKELLKKTRQRRVAQITLSTGDAFEMYFAPLTEAEDEKIREAVESDTRSNAYGLRVLINKAEYEDGEKMFSLAEAGMMRQEYAQRDLNKMMIALIDNGGTLASEDPKSNQGGNQK
jgi:hypothetical protein